MPKRFRNFFQTRSKFYLLCFACSTDKIKKSVTVELNFFSLVLHCFQSFFLCFRIVIHKMTGQFNGTFRRKRNQDSFSPSLLLCEMLPEDFLGEIQVF